MVAFKLRCFLGTAFAQTARTIRFARAGPASMSVIFDPHVGTGGKQHVHDVAAFHSSLTSAPFCLWHLWRSRRRRRRSAPARFWCAHTDSQMSAVVSDDS